jgi:hypothetical protein
MAFAIDSAWGLAAPVRGRLDTILMVIESLFPQDEIRKIMIANSAEKLCNRFGMITPCLSSLFANIVYSTDVGSYILTSPFFAKM